MFKQINRLGTAIITGLTLGIVSVSSLLSEPAYAGCYKIPLPFGGSRQVCPNISSEEHYFKVTNKCDSPVELSVTYTNTQGTLVTDERTLSPGESIRLASLENKWDYKIKRIGSHIGWGGQQGKLNGSPEPNMINTCSN